MRSEHRASCRLKRWFKKYALKFLRSRCAVQLPCSNGISRLSYRYASVTLTWELQRWNRRHNGMVGELSVTMQATQDVTGHACNTLGCHGIRHIAPRRRIICTRTLLYPHGLFTPARTCTVAPNEACVLRSLIYPGCWRQRGESLCWGMTGQWRRLASTEVIR